MTAFKKVTVAAFTTHDSLQALTVSHAVKSNVPQPAGGYSLFSVLGKCLPLILGHQVHISTAGSNGRCQSWTQNPPSEKAGWYGLTSLCKSDVTDVMSGHLYFLHSNRRQKPILQGGGGWKETRKEVVSRVKAQYSAYSNWTRQHPATDYASLLVNHSWPRPYLFTFSVTSGNKTIVWPSEMVIKIGSWTVT